MGEARRHVNHFLFGKRPCFERRDREGGGHLRGRMFECVSSSAWQGQAQESGEVNCRGIL